MLEQEILEELRAIRLLLESQNRPVISVNRRMQIKKMAEEAHKRNMANPPRR